MEFFRVSASFGVPYMDFLFFSQFSVKNRKPQAVEVLEHNNLLG